MTMPTSTTDKFIDCWTVRDAFSPGDRSVQRTAPVSLAIVTALLVGCGGPLLVCEDCEGREVENATRAARFRCMLTGPFVTERRSWIASVGL
jgi:hypothetical protein